MKPLLYTKTLIAIAVAIVAAAAAVSQAQEQPIPPPAPGSALPSGIVPGSPLAEVVKMLQAGVDVSTIESYVQNSPSPFNLDADKILLLKDEGAPNELINAMLERDKVLYAAAQTPPPTPAPAPPVVAGNPDTPLVAGSSEAPVTTAATVDSAPPASDVTQDYFDTTLTPYGSWVDVAGYGRCWRPTVVAYDPAWAPYGDRGHWTYTDYGWYWDSDYAWGLTFHYGRWFNHARLGWCWYPDTVWAPSWVTWRSGGDYRGWAPLPPFAVFRPGAGFFYRGVSVGLDFDFGLRPEFFRFLASEHFCDPHPRSYFVDRAHAVEVFQHTAAINHFEVRDHMVVNNGFGVEHITGVNHRPLAPIHLRDLPNAGRQGWRGEGFERTMRPGNPSRDLGSSHDVGRGVVPGNVGHPADHPYGQNSPGGDNLIRPKAPGSANAGNHPTTYSGGASGQNSSGGNGQSGHGGGTYAPVSASHSTSSPSVPQGNPASTVRPAQNSSLAGQGNPGSMVHPGQNTYSAGQGNPGTMVRPGQSSSPAGYGGGGMSGVARPSGGYGQSSVPVPSHSPVAPAGGYQSPASPGYSSAPGGAPLPPHASAPEHQAPAASPPAASGQSSSHGSGNSGNNSNNGHENGQGH